MKKFHRSNNIERASKIVFSVQPFYLKLIIFIINLFKYLGDIVPCYIIKENRLHLLL